MENVFSAQALEARRIARLRCRAWIETVNVSLGRSGTELALVRKLIDQAVKGQTRPCSFELPGYLLSFGRSKTFNWPGA